MTAYITRRLLLMIPTFLGETLVGFAITRMVPGGPLEREIRAMRNAAVSEGGGGGVTSTVDLGKELTDEQMLQLKKKNRICLKMFP